MKTVFGQLMNGKIYFTLSKEAFSFNSWIDSQNRYERHLRDAGIPYHRHYNSTIVDVTKIISIEGYEVSAIFGWRTDWK